MEAHLAARVKDLPHIDAPDSVEPVEQPAHSTQIKLAEAGAEVSPTVSPALRLQKQLNGALHQSRQLAAPHELATVIAVFLACSLGTIAIVTLY